MIATPATAPITMPAIAPPDRDEEEEDEEEPVGEGAVDEGAVDEGAVDNGAAVWVRFGPAVVVGFEVDVVVVVEDDVCVAAISFAGSKVHELADGDAELSDEYVSFSVLLLMFLRTSWAEFQQMLIWPDVAVQTSLIKVSRRRLSTECKRTHEWYRQHQV